MKRILTVAGLIMLASSAAHAGDAAKGEKGFKKCKACHMIVSDAGETIVKGGKTGPNLYGVAGRTLGTAEGFKYSKSMIAAGEAGQAWDMESFAAFTADPNGYLKEATGDSKAKSKMSFRLKNGAEDVYAYLESVAAE
ncbi:c-type cytochrome [Epibacterium sp. SM1979]|uniref:C-type cytochrome n=1 Tax=Tritonibacter litoralis TaxID=2662264 RepID=A0A843YC59_9RHOB|nr:c-type cytochrome [Tritonibacter litoralis]MQQ08541.1 c-type cytochrome [Tritonibacter litoralis]